MRPLALWLVAASLLTIPVPAWAQAPAAPAARAAAPTLEERLHSKLDAWLKDRGAPGATAAVVFNDGRVVTVAAGLSRKDPATPMRPTDRMFSGSIGKTYWAAVALQLVEEGRLDLDKSVKQYIGDRPWYARLPNADTITVRQLMNHTSGIPEHVQGKEFTDALKREPAKAWTPDELVAFVLDKPPLSAPGQGWAYADTNFILLGIVVEKVLAGSFDREVDRRLLMKLGLADTQRADRADLDRLVSGYTGDSNIFTDRAEVAVGGRYFMNPQFEWCGGGFVTTASDLAKWARLLYAGAVLKPDTRAAMLTGVAAKTGPGDQYGLGAQIWSFPCGKAVGHSGWFPGYLSYMAWFPEKRMAVAVQVNTDEPGKSGKLRALLCDLIEAAAAPVP